MTLANALWATWDRGALTDRSQWRPDATPTGDLRPRIARIQFWLRVDASDPRLGLILSLPEAWGRPEQARWEAARHMLDVDCAGEPPSRLSVMCPLVSIKEALNDFFSEEPCGKRRAC